MNIGKNLLKVCDLYLIFIYIKYNMEQLNSILIILSLILSFFNTCLIIGFVYYLNKKTNLKLDDMPKDLSEALSKIVVYLEKEFESNFKIHQQMSDWEHDTFQKVMQSSSENFNFIAKQQYLNENLLNNILTSLGFRSRFDETEIEKPKRTYADPPSPVEIEGLKIVDGKSEIK